jgi:hypothetical protein
VRTIGIDEADGAVRGAECDQVFAEKPNAQGRAVLLGQFLREGRWPPEAAEVLTPGRALSDTGKPLILGDRKHVVISSICLIPRFYGDVDGAFL